MKTPYIKALSVALLAVPMILAASGGSALAQDSFDDFAGDENHTRPAVAQAQNQEQGGGMRGQFGGGQRGGMRGQGGGGQQGGMGGGGNMEDRAKKMQQALGLSAEQMQKLKALKEKGSQQSKTLHTQLRTKQQAMTTYMKSPGATEAGAKQHFNEVHNLQRQMGELRIKTWFEMRKLMTPEQVAKFSEMRDKMKSRGGQGGGRQGRMGGQGGGGQQGGMSGGQGGGMRGGGQGQQGGQFGGQGNGPQGQGGPQFGDEQEMGVQ